MFKYSVDASKKYSLMLQRNIDNSKKNRTDDFKKRWFKTFYIWHVDIFKEILIIQNHSEYIMMLRYSVDNSMHYCFKTDLRLQSNSGVLNVDCFTIILMLQNNVDALKQL